MKKVFADVIGATQAKYPPGKGRSVFGEAVIKLMADHKPFRQTNLTFIADCLEAMKKIIDQFLKKG